LYHDVVAGWSVKGILHFMNKVHAYWLVLKKASYSGISDIWQQGHSHLHL
jgi:hypothetical protein